MSLFIDALAKRIVHYMDNKDKQYIVVKTEKQQHTCCEISMGPCLFAVEEEEWDEIGKHLTTESVAYTKGHGEKRIHLYKLYENAITFEADVGTIQFLLLNGTNDALKYLRKGTTVSRNKQNLYQIFNKLALFRDMENSALVLNLAKKFDFDCFNPGFDHVSISNSCSYGVHEDETVLVWRIPKNLEDCIECEKWNENLMREALERNSTTLNSILGAKKFWCITGVHHVYVRLYIPDDVCLWDPDVILEVDHKIQSRKQSFGYTKKLKFREMCQIFESFKNKDDILQYFGED